MIMWLVVSPIIVIAIYVAFVGYQADQVRRRELSRYAHETGQLYFPDGIVRLTSVSADSESIELPSGGFAETLGIFEPFSIDPEGSVKHLICKQVGAISLYAFEYRFAKDRGGRGGKTTLSVFLCRAGLIFPQMRLRPQTSIHAVGRALGMTDIDLDSEEFNKRYVITGERNSLYAFLNPRAIEYLLSIEARDWQFGNMFVVVTEDRGLTPSSIEAVFKEMQGFIELVPNYLITDRGFQPKWTHPLELL